jgi:hypothetical protein
LVVQDFIGSIVKLHHYHPGGWGAICEIVHHQGHQGTRRKYLEPKAFVILRALGGSGLHRLHRETAPHHPGQGQDFDASRVIT